MNEIIVTTQDLLNITDAAKELHITRMTIYRWLDAKKIISIRLGGVSYIPRSEIERLQKGAANGDK